MIHIVLEVQDMFSDRLAEFGRKAPAMALRICRTIGQGFRAYTRKNYLRGQVLGKRTGTLYKTIKIVTDRKSRQAVIVRPWAKLANIYHNPAGADIVPSKGKMLKFEVDGRTIFTKHVHLEPRPWVPRARAEFQWNPEIQKAADTVITRELKKLEAARGTG
jgi:hypothetical protein